MAYLRVHAVSAGVRIAAFFLAVILYGCGPALVTGLEVGASVASLGNNVLGIDTTIAQDTGKPTVWTWLKDHLPWNH